MLLLSKVFSLVSSNEVLQSTMENYGLMGYWVNRGGLVHQLNLAEPSIQSRGSFLSILEVLRDDEDPAIQGF